MGSSSRRLRRQSLVMSLMLLGYGLSARAQDALPTADSAPNSGPLVARAEPATGTLIARAEPATLSGLERYFQKAIADWQVPGLAVAIVKDGKVVLARGYGVRVAGGHDPVDEHTRFAIASLSKGFTAAAVGMLVDEGKLAWDDPVIRHLPGFAVADPYVTRELTIRDLLAHRTGLDPIADALWYSTGYSRAEILSRMLHLKQGSSLRATYSYQNVGYLVAGEALAARAGMSWDELMSRRIFTPLGMTDSSTSVRALEAVPNVARPHSDRGGAPRPISYRNVDNIGPAASLNSSAADMARWLQLWLEGGTLEGQRLLSAATVQEILTPQMNIGLGPYGRKLYPESHFETYGLGWVLQDYRGKLVVWNTGGMDGMACSIALLPEERLGVVVLANAPRISLPEALVFRTIDHYLGVDKKDWSGMRLAMSLEGRKRKAEADRQLEASRAPDAPPSLALEKYAGTYRQPLIGDFTVRLEAGRLEIRLSDELSGILEPWRHDTFRIRWKNPDDGTSQCTFQLNAEGAVAAFDLETYGRFDRQPERR